MGMLQISNDTVALSVDLAGGAIHRFDRHAASGPVPVFHRGAVEADVCFPLIPFGNRLRGNAFVFDGGTHRLQPNTASDPHYIHGDAWLGHWRTIAHDHHELTIAYDHAGKDGPYAYRAEQRFALSDNMLSVSLSVTNRARRSLPYGLGLHPFLPMTPATIVDFTAERYWEQDAAFLPLKSHPARGGMDFSGGRRLPGTWMNTEFEGWNGAATIMWPETGSRLRIEADAQFSRCMIFVSHAAFDALYRHDWFCFEPMTHSVDAHHRADLGGLVALEPDETLAGSCRFIVE
ncbi:aldose 1-epimerase [Mesorhizobium sp. M4B.F.Ca.ET.089.01.1.1]|nr:aldose 1-epimerase [Mesorhizobium sp. M4B.F.Ca.ET.089.01.1.1]